MFKFGLEKSEESQRFLELELELILALVHRIHWIIEKIREFQKNIYFCFIDCLGLILTVWIKTNCGKILKRWEYQTTYLTPEKSLCRSKT